MEFYHYPPDLMNLLIDTIPKLNKSKSDVLLFFKGVGIPYSIIQPLEIVVNRDRNSISKYQIARQILDSINAQNDKYLRQRREILNRICHFDTFDVCYDNDRDKAKANVAEISKLVNMKDTLTKYENYLGSKQQEELDNKKRKNEERQLLINKFDEIGTKFNSLFSMTDPIKRGKALEPVLNDLFVFYKISLSDAFTVTMGNSTVEQIDGAMILDGKAYIIEMKWEKEPVGVDMVSRFINRLFLRNDVGGVMISASSFAKTAIITANEALSQKNIILVDLKDIFDVINLRKDLQQYLRLSLRNSQINKKSDFKTDIALLENLNFTDLCK